MNLHNIAFDKAFHESHAFDSFLNNNSYFLNGGMKKYKNTLIILK